MLAFEGELDHVDSRELTWYLVVFVPDSGVAVSRIASQLAGRMVLGRLMPISGAVRYG